TARSPPESATSGSSVLSTLSHALPRTMYWGRTQLCPPDHATPLGVRPTVKAQRVCCRRTGARSALRASIRMQRREVEAQSPGLADDFGIVQDDLGWCVRMSSRT